MSWCGGRGLVNVVGVNKEGHEGTGQAGGRFDDVRHRKFRAVRSTLRRLPLLPENCPVLRQSFNTMKIKLIGTLHVRHRGNNIQLGIPCGGEIRRDLLFC